MTSFPKKELFKKSFLEISGSSLPKGQSPLSKRSLQNRIGDLGEINVHLTKQYLQLQCFCFLENFNLEEGKYCFTKQDPPPILTLLFEEGLH